MRSAINMEISHLNCNWGLLNPLTQIMIFGISQEVKPCRLQIERVNLQHLISFYHKNRFLSCFLVIVMRTRQHHFIYILNVVSTKTINFKAL